MSTLTSRTCRTRWRHTPHSWCRPASWCCQTWSWPQPPRTHNSHILRTGFLSLSLLRRWRGSINFTVNKFIRAKYIGGCFFLHFKQNWHLSIQCTHDDGRDDEYDHHVDQDTTRGHSQHPGGVDEKHPVRPHGYVGSGKKPCNNVQQKKEDIFEQKLWRWRYSCLGRETL